MGNVKFVIPISLTEVCKILCNNEHPGVGLHKVFIPTGEQLCYGRPLFYNNF